MKNKRKSIRRPISGFLTLTCAIVILSGCTTAIPTGKFDALNNSTQTLLTNSTDTYTRVEKLQRTFAIATAPNTKIDTDTFKPTIEGKTFDLTPELAFRESALEVLAKYTKVLNSFSSKDYLSDVDKASQDLAGSLNNLIQTSKVVSTADASKASGILATMVDMIGKQIVERQRLDALKNVMDLAQPPVETLSMLVVGSNEKIGQAVDIMLDRIIAHANAERPAYGTLQRFNFDTDVANLIAESEDIKGSLNTINTAMSKIPGAHKEIRDDLDKKQTGFDDLHSLIQEAQRASKFYGTLGK